MQQQDVCGACSCRRLLLRGSITVQALFLGLHIRLFSSSSPHTSSNSTPPFSLSSLIHWPVYVHVFPWRLRVHRRYLDVTMQESGVVSVFAPAAALKICACYDEPEVDVCRCTARGLTHTRGHPASWPCSCTARF